MSRMIFVNLPIKDVHASREFFTTLGFAFNDQFCDERSLCVAIDDNIFVMLLEESAFKGFINGEISDATKGTEVLLCLTCEGRDEVDTMITKAVESGGRPWKDTFSNGPMYGGSFQDPDGHVWEVMHMDLAAATA